MWLRLTDETAEAQEKYIHKGFHCTDIPLYGGVVVEADTNGRFVDEILDVYHKLVGVIVVLG